MPNFAAFLNTFLELGIGSIDVPTVPVRVPGFSIPRPPKIPRFSVDVDIDPPELPRIGQRIPGFSLPKPPKIPTLHIPCPFE